VIPHILYRSIFLIIIFSQNLFVWLITSVPYYHLDLVVVSLVDFFSSWQFFLSRKLCHLDLLYSFTDNLACCLSLLDKDILLLLSSIPSHHHIISFHYLSFAVMHQLFHYLSFTDVKNLTESRDYTTTTNFNQPSNNSMFVVESRLLSTSRLTL
jgi:hypothetical protein